MTLRSVLTIIATLAVLFAINWMLTCVVLGGILLVIGFVFFGSRKWETRLSKVQQETKAVVNQVTEEAITNIKTVKAFATESSEFKKF